VVDLGDLRPQENVINRAIRLGVRRTLKSIPNVADGGPGVVLLFLPEGYHLDDFFDILLEFLERGAKGNADAGALILVRASDTKDRIRSNFDSEAQAKDRVLILAEQHADLPIEVNVATDQLVSLPPISARDFQAACRQTLQLKVSLKQARRAVRYPHNLLRSAIRAGRSIENVLQRLEDNSPSTTQRELRTAPLSEMHGYGEAKAWGLQLAIDIADWRLGRIPWSDVDCGILLSGPPGVGKTVFARALANQCKVSLVATSFAQWQAAGTGHLGDCLKAMRKTFAEAKSKSPSIVFIDELDSIGNRATFDHREASYSTQVVNALLELLDGLGNREGVVVVGATNDASRIDPAALRSGRLDKHVEIPTPSPDDRLAILGHLSGLSFGGGVGAQLVLATNGMTGADLDKAVRDGRRRARTLGRSLMADDIIKTLPPLTEMPNEFLEAVAVHETGHTLVGVELAHGKFLGTVVSRRLPARSATHQCGVASFEIPRFMRHDRQSYLDRIAMLLAGAAAEELWLGSHSDGCIADFEMATRLATVMHASCGMGQTLRYSDAESDAELEALRRGDRQLRKDIDDDLLEQFSRAKAILAGQGGLATKVVDELIRHGQITPKRLTSLAASIPQTAEGHGWPQESIEPGQVMELRRIGMPAGDIRHST
jgi:hypothetical protein